jgi:hypothetical protein
MEANKILNADILDIIFDGKISNMALINYAKPIIKRLASAYYYRLSFVARIYRYCICEFYQ